MHGIKRMIEQFKDCPSEQLPIIEVFILTYERPQLLLEAIQSVLEQDYRKLRVVVSDNSVSDATREALSSLKDDRLVYVKRTPSLPPLQHFNQVLSEVQADYFMLFHDDDIMLPGCLNALIKPMLARSDLAAVAGNARFLYGRKLSNRKFIHSQRDLLIDSPAKLLRRYFTSSDYAPFPSYLYRRSALHEARLRPELGKHCDVVFLSHFCENQKIVMLKDVVMHYRIHLQQDSAVCNLSDRRALYQWSVNCGYFAKDSPEIRFYRLIGLLDRTIQTGEKKYRRLVPILCELAFLHLRFFPLQFFLLFIRLSQRVIKNLFMRSRQNVL